MPSGLFRQLALPFLCLCFAASCAPHMSRVISEEQSQLLDSLPLLTNAGPADWIQDIKTPTKGVNIKLSDGTTTKSQRLYVRWGEGSSFTKAIAFSPPENLPFNCQMAEAVGSLSFHIRKIRASQSDPTLIIKLCDTDANCSSTHLAPHHLERTNLDTSWQEVRVPLTDLHRGRSATVWTKAMKFEFGLEGFGEVEIENIVLVPMEHRRKSSKRRRHPHLSPIANGYHYAFQEEIQHAWGLGERRNLRTFDVKPYRGVNDSEALVLKWDYLQKPLSREKVESRDNTFGLSWNGWKPYAPPEKVHQARLVFMLRNLDSKKKASVRVPLNVGLVDHLAYGEFVNVSDFLDGTQGQWQKCTVPLTEFQWLSDTTDGIQSIEQITFSVDSAGHLFLDNIRLEY